MREGTGEKRPKDHCKDCWIEFWTGDGTGLFPPKRDAPFPGPRCYTHDRVKRREDKRKSAERRDESVYGLLPGGHEQLMAIQGGKCAICQIATGASRRLSVDHDHATGRVRGLLCRPCNTLLGHLRDDTKAIQRAYFYLTQPPASKLNRRYFTGGKHYDEL